MAIATDRLIRIPEEYAQHLSALAIERGITESALIEEALALLFCPTTEEREILRGLIAETGPSVAQIVPSLSPDEITLAIPVPIEPLRLYRTQEEC